MSDRGLSREVADLRERIGPALCADPAPCRINATTETVLLPGGAEERHGTPPPPLCASCPQHEEWRRPVRWVEIVKDCRSLHHGEADEVAASAATLRDSGMDRGLVGPAYPTDDRGADSGARAGARGRFARQLAGRPPGKAGPRRARTGTTTPAWGRRRGNPDGPLGVRTMTTKIPRGPRERLLSRPLRSCGASAPTAGVVPCPSAASSLCTGPPYVAPSDARIALWGFTPALGGVRYFPRGRGRYIGRQADDWTPRYHGRGGGSAGHQRRGRAGPHKARHHRVRA